MNGYFRYRPLLVCYISLNACPLLDSYQERDLFCSSLSSGIWGSARWTVGPFCWWQWRSMFYLRITNTVALVLGEDISGGAFKTIYKAIADCKHDFNWSAYKNEQNRVWSFKRLNKFYKARSIITPGVFSKSDSICHGRPIGSLLFRCGSFTRNNPRPCRRRCK